MYVDNDLSAATKRTQRQNDWACAVVFGGVDKRSERGSVEGPRSSENECSTQGNIFFYTFQVISGGNGFFFQRHCDFDENAPGMTFEKLWTVCELCGFIHS